MQRHFSRNLLFLQLLEACSLKIDKNLCIPQKFTQKVQVD